MTNAHRMPFDLIGARMLARVVPALCVLPVVEGAAPAVIQPETLRLAPNDWIPNHPRLPVLVYRDAIAPSGRDPAARFEARFAQNGWPPQWRNGVYDFHHFHPSTHEVLGIAAGTARVMLGGPLPGGHEVTLRAGDVAVLPAGTGHCRIEASRDFLVVGAYPPDQGTGISRAALDAERLAALERVGYPKSDPLYGAQGPLVKLWHGA
ncbi:cupin domain-containing protein [Paraburkholderia kururiensis]|uniref:cupin domain-containing protein n=1 Tax=Paraburkholderia kururiensis TaxID=984307 RepID=UPI001F29418A|nr:cupin domain-containing protein [Paraburkholderia kururiensis]